MISARPRRYFVAIVVGGVCVAGASAQPAEAFNPIKPICAVGGLISGLVGKVCNVASHAGGIVGAGKKLTAVGSAASSVGAKATFALGLAAMVTWVLGGAKYALNETAHVISTTTTPQLRSTWFSSTYWRVAGIAALLTLPFLFAAAVQALVQSDLHLLVRAALGYLPLAFLAVGIATPLTMLLLSASDQLSAIVSSAAGNASAHFLGRASGAIGALTILSRSPFLVFFAGLLTVAGAVVLWFELLLRAAAVYVIVLMLPLAFAALVWPARRVWAIRAVELLIALILSKFATVAVLSLGGAAMSQSATQSITGMFAGVVLLGMGAFAPWVLLRLLPLAEVASGAIGSFRAESAAPRRSFATAWGAGHGSHDWATATTEMDGAESTPEPEAADDAARAQVERLSGIEALVPGSPAPQDSEQGDEPQPSPRASSGSTGEAPEPPNERSPGLGPIWQMDDFTWPATTLGLEDGWPPPPIEPDAGHTSPPFAGQDPSGNGSAVSGSPSRPDSSETAGRPHEDHDPTPPPQPPEDGRL